MKRRNFLAGVFAPLFAMLPWQNPKEDRRRSIQFLCRTEKESGGRVYRIAQPQDVFTAMHDIGVEFAITWRRIHNVAGEPDVSYLWVDKYEWGKGKQVSQDFRVPPVSEQKHPQDVLHDVASWLMQTMTSEEYEKFFLLIEERLVVAATPPSSGAR